MNTQNIVEQIKGSKPSKGYSEEYDVYVFDEIVVKVYHDKESFEADIQLHKKLDQHHLLPKMITSFCTDEAMYLVVEKINALFAEDFKPGGVGANSANQALREYEKSEKWITMVEDYEEKIKKYTKSVIYDTHPGNFGYDKSGNFMCLDEGCFWF